MTQKTDKVDTEATLCRFSSLNWQLQNHLYYRLTCNNRAGNQSYIVLHVSSWGRCARVPFSLKQVNESLKNDLES